MPDEAKLSLKLVFVNDVNSAEMEVAMTSKVSDVKAKILQEHWPTSQPTLDTIERLRLFAGGREIGGKEDDAKLLKDIKIPVVSQGPTPVHVAPVLKGGSGAAAGQSKEAVSGEASQCFCTLL
mmetsp:Transcript_62550/g.117012  ORF Transcript_62550/g.117012 Transcript_62550/m.117012 type:complete len:123 (+) Transcript_62550:153-521(+)